MSPLRIQYGSKLYPKPRESKCTTSHGDHLRDGKHNCEDSRLYASGEVDISSSCVSFLRTSPPLEVIEDWVESTLRNTPGFRGGNNALRLAIGSGDATAVRKCLREGAEPNWPGSGETP